MKTTRRNILKMGAAAGAAGAITLAAPAIAAGPINIRFSHLVSPKGHPKGEAAEYFQQLVAQRLAGEVELDVYSGGSLFNDEKVLEAIALGAVEMAVPSLSKFETFTQAFRVFDLPFIFNDAAHVNAFQDGETGQAILSELDRSGLVGLGYWQLGMKQISANKPLLTPEDAKGLKFRIQPSEVIQAQFEALGANPQKMAFPEVYGALQAGVVDGQENTWTNIWKQKFWEVQDGVTESNHGTITYALVAGSSFWKGLGEDLRNEMAKIIAEVTAFEREKSTVLEAESKAKIIAQGVEVRQLTAEQRKLWVDAMSPVWDRFRDGIGGDIIDAAAKG